MNPDLDEKVCRLFSRLGREHLESLNPTRSPEVVRGRIAQALSDRLPYEQARDLAFHLTDWNSDAAFIVALLLFSEEFTAAEIADGVQGFLIHVPNHVAAAAKLLGYPVEDIFGVDALSGASEETQS